MGLRPSLKRRYRRAHSTDLNITPFIDILVCLILFLLMTAVLGKSAIVNLYLPTEEETANAAPVINDVPKMMPTVAITKNGFIVSNGQGMVDHLPLHNGQFDFAKLSEKLQHLKSLPGATNNIIVLPEANLRYQILISTMDTCREYRDEKKLSHVLFPTISLGEYRAATNETKESQGT